MGTNRDPQVAARDAIDRVHHALLVEGRLPRWVAADSALISEIITGKGMPRTAAGRALSGIFRWLGFSPAGLLAMGMVGTLVAIRWWLATSTQVEKPMGIDTVFIGFGAGNEDDLYRTLCEENQSCRLYRVFQQRPQTLGSLGRPSLRKLIMEVWSTIVDLSRLVRSTESPVVDSHKGSIAASVARRIPVLVYYKLWARQLPSSLRRLVAISLDTGIFGIAAGLEMRKEVSVEYWQHGFHEQSLLGPEGLKGVRALNAPEARFLEARCPGASVRVAQAPVESLGGVSERKRLILFASQYESPLFRKEREAERIQELLDWADAHGIGVVVRPHPKEDAGFWAGRFASVPIDTTSENFAMSLRVHRPLFVCSWWSTALADAVAADVVPIVLASEQPAPLSQIAFPVRAVSVAFPEESSRLAAAAKSDVRYKELLAEKQNAMFGWNSDKSIGGA